MDNTIKYTSAILGMFVIWKYLNRAKINTVDVKNIDLASDIVNTNKPYWTPKQEYLHFDNTVTMDRVEDLAPMVVNLQMPLISTKDFSINTISAPKTTSTYY